MHQDHYSQYPHASFGADPPLAPLPSTPLSTIWLTAKLWTPQWLKESTTIAVGVFGGMALFRVFRRKLPGNAGGL